MEVPVGRTVIGNLCSDVRMAECEAAYFAGFVDGEGTLTIIKSARAQTRTGFRYHALFSISNSNRELLEWLRTTCGNGMIVSNFHKKVKAYHRTVFVLRFNQNQIRHVLPQLLPWLRAKREQAEMLLTFLGWSSAGTHQRSENEWNDLERLRVSISQLNQRGVVVKEFVRFTVKPSLRGNNQYKKTKTH